MTLKSYLEKLTEEDLAEWQERVAQMDDNIMQAFLNLNSQMEEYEICQIIYKEIERRNRVIPGNNL